MTAKARLSTALKNSKKMPGQTSPKQVIIRRTDSTVHFCAINESAQWPATEDNKHQHSVYQHQQQQSKTWKKLTTKHSR